MADPSWKAEKVEEFIDHQLEQMGGNPKGRRGSIRADECALCCKSAKSFRDDLSAKEYTISGMCQECQDDSFVEPWHPGKPEIAWAEGMLDPLRDQAMWGCSWGVYDINKDTKTLTLKSLAPIQDDLYLKDMLYKTKKTFKAIGWSTDHEEYYKRFR
ncbi:MAG: hypothetical protein ACWGQW_03980 [bacterium]